MLITTVSENLVIYKGTVHTSETVIYSKQPARKSETMKFTITVLLRTLYKDFHSVLPIGNTLLMFNI